MSLGSRLKDMGKQVGKLVDEGAEFFEEAPPEIIEKRREVCYNCPELITDNANHKLWHCNQCGCLANEKTKYVSQSCPMEYW